MENLRTGVNENYFLDSKMHSHPRPRLLFIYLALQCILQLMVS